MVSPVSSIVLCGILIFCVEPKMSQCKGYSLIVQSDVLRIPHEQKLQENNETCNRSAALYNNFENWVNNAEHQQLVHVTSLLPMDISKGAGSATAIQ